uniref:GNAT family N-acetyltransferase n=1 Tax=Thaumasiovibrio occultus TaxID=1891184 RepID=UPI000B357E88|nr:GNAT family protein [Thaumasiovibrio occultus]
MQLNEIELESATVRLIPLRLEHKDALLDAASDGNLWELWYTSVPNRDAIDGYLQHALSDQDRGVALPFTVVEKATNKIIGTTRLFNVDHANRRLEIGHTWYAQSYHRSSVNTECKLLLLTHAFESLHTIAVEFRTHWHNQQSRQAIARLGAKQDGVLRNHQIMPNGSYRDTVVFSIVESEWSAVKTSLQYKLTRRS